jgi:hypothetical protein
MGPRRESTGTPGLSDPVAGRYGLHFHLMKDASRGSVVKGVVVRDSPNHAFVSHESHGVTFRDCISHDTIEDAFWWDPNQDPENPHGPPTDDVLYERCVASLVRSGMHSNSFVRLSGFFLGSRHGNAIRESVAVGVVGGIDASGFVWPENSAGTWKFENCVAHNNGSHGINVWQNNDLPNVISHLIAYHNGRFGILSGQYANGVQFKDSILYSNGIASVVSVAASLSSATQRFIGIHCDQAGLSPYCVVATQRNSAPQAAVEFSGCSFRGYSKAALVVSAEAPFRNRLILGNCTFEGNEFWLESNIHAATIIPVQDLVHGSITLRRADQSGTFHPEWNASVLN